jgi:malonyl-CoA/methylmalonyl-CoA synthetase
MAVPTIYFKLISSFESFPKERQIQISGILAKFRLMVSGSAALPVTVMEQWHQISGHYLLERYGMTEIGMAISNPYSGERRAGHIGQALPGVEIRLVDESNKFVSAGEPGEIQVKGPGVFKAYWGKPDATEKSFTSDGWFKTGDIAVFDASYYKILGRDSIDIIKSGGYKISALEIEEVIRTHPQIKDCAVVGIPDTEWGELVVAALITVTDLNSKELATWLKERMPTYKIPRQFIQLEDLPRNAMGKVTKNELKKHFIS